MRCPFDPIKYLDITKRILDYFESYVKKKKEDFERVDYRDGLKKLYREMCEKKKSRKAKMRGHLKFLCTLNLLKFLLKEKEKTYEAFVKELNELREIAFFHCSIRRYLNRYLLKSFEQIESGEALEKGLRRTIIDKVSADLKSKEDFDEPLYELFIRLS
jgi:hypothetical protein